VSELALDLPDEPWSRAAGDAYGVDVLVAVAQPSVVPYDVAANAKAHADVIRSTGARLVVFPELSLTGYNLDAPAVETDDPRLEPIISACTSSGAVALVGAPIADPDGREFIATLRIDSDGAVVAYRKINVHPPEGERFAAGDQHVVMDLDGWRLGLAICRDASLPEHAAAVVAAGATAYVASTVNEPTDPRDERMRDRARVHGIPVVASCSAGLDGSLFGCGGSGFWRAGGELAAQASTEPDEVVVYRLPDLVG
jgi:predicted amidohydrolase